MARQRRVLLRADDPPETVMVLDEPSLFRLVGSAVVMAAQGKHLIGMAAMPHVTLQVLPSVSHPAMQSRLIIAESAAAYVEHMAGGYVFTDAPTVSSLARVLGSLRAESYRASESTMFLERIAGQRKARGGSPVTAVPTAAIAWK